MKKLAIIMPVYNEEKNIQKVLCDWKVVLSSKSFDIIVLNDGSVDKTRLVLNKIKKKIKNLKVINKLNGGHGETIFTGYEYAIKKKYKYIFQVDSDDQFSSKDFSKLWKLREKDYDLILGNRFNRDDPLLRIFLSKVILRLFFIIYFRKNLKDANIPYRLIKYNFLKKFISAASKKYLAPNILMTLMAKNIIFLNINHFKRLRGLIRWPFSRLIYFGIRLIFEIIEFKKKVK